MPAPPRARRRRKRKPSSDRKAYRKQPRQERAQVTVEAILDATRRLLVKDGYERFSTNRVAKLAGVSIGSLYQYFPSKRALIGALLEQHAERFGRTLRRERRELAQLPLPRVIRRMVERMVEAHRSDAEVMRIVVREVPRYGLESEAIDAGFERAIAGMRAYLATQPAAASPRNDELSAFIVIHAIESLTKAALARDPRMLDADLVEEITRLIVRYLGHDRADEA